MSYHQDDTQRKMPTGDRPFPFHPVALKILGDAVLAATLLRVATLPPEQGLGAMLAALLIGIGASAAAGTMLVRSGRQQVWDVTSVACLAAMAVMLLLHGSLLLGLLLAAFALWRWRDVAGPTA